MVFAHPSHNEKGFSLVELIATLVIMGIIGVGASLFMVYGVQGFMLARIGNETYQKSNIAMERLSREMKNMDTIYQFSSDSIRFERGGATFGIALVGSNIQLVRANALPSAGTPGFTLMDGVTGFVLGFENPDGSAWAIPGNNSISGLSKITIRMDVSVGSNSRTFTVEINPFNNNTVNAPTS